MKLGALVASALLAFALVSWFSAPPGTQWLGDGVQNSSDVAVYFSYLRQGAEGHILLSDLFSVEANRSRFDAFWSTLGFFARAGIPLILLHEFSRAACTLVLIYAISQGATSLWDDRRDATLATILAIGGFGTGWIYTIALGVTGAWTAQTYGAPDLVTEFTVGPILLGGSHAILSLALLLTSIRFIWSGIRTSQLRSLLFGSIAGMALLSFHPYFTPVLTLVALLASATTRTSWKRRMRDLTVLGLILLPPIAYYAWLLTDPVFGTHHLERNILPLAPLPIWIITLLPFIGSTAWLFRKHLLPKRLEWTHAWLIASVACLIVLPVPWKRKLTEGLAIPLVLITMPAWFAIRDWIQTRQPRLMRSLLSGFFILVAWFGPLQLIATELAWRSQPSESFYFYQPTSLFRITDDLRAHAEPDAVLLSDRRWVNVWLPSLTGLRTWIGHDHETPDFEQKWSTYNELLLTGDKTRAKNILRQAGITYFLTTTHESRDHFSPLLKPEWKILREDGAITAWGQK